MDYEQIKAEIAERKAAGRPTMLSVSRTLRDLPDGEHVVHGVTVSKLDGKLSAFGREMTTVDLAQDIVKAN